MNQSNMLKHYVVDADPKTGEWLGEPEETGAEVQATEWAKKQDTSDEHYDQYEHNGETRAITLRWKGQFTEVLAASFEAKYQGETLGYFATADEAQNAIDAAREANE